MSQASKILMIEDDPLLVKMYQTKLELEKFEVAVASDGEEGLTKLAAFKPALILLDLMMPGMDGFGFLKEIKKKKSKVPVIVFSNLGQETDIKQAKELGAVDYLVKANLTPRQVVEKVRKHLAI